MHPAFSVIVFTTLSGAGFGLLAWAGFYVALSPAGASRALILGAVLLGMTLATGGLLSSLFHLGQPLRSWRAFSQWRSSWLSREGVLAVVTLGLAAGLALLLSGSGRSILAGIAVALSSAAVLTVWATAMIYRSLKTVPAWHNRWTVPLYLTHSLYAGVLCLCLLALWCGLRGDRFIVALTALSGVLALAATAAYWREVDNSRLPSAASATALQGIGTPRGFERPHTEESFITREMLFVVGRRHARRLRRICLLLLAASLVAALAASAAGRGAPAIALLGLLAAIAAIGVQRWLFFAEARHVVGLYYAAAPAPLARD